MKVFRLAAVLLFASRVLAAQAPAQAAPPAQPAAPPPATGSITGHVYLGDSRLPARIAYVLLLPIGATDAGDKKPASGALIQTGLDGSFVMPDVLPGTYYVAAMKLGYVSPVPASLIENDDYGPNPQDVKEALAAALTPVVVAANRISTTDIVLTRGAVISGSVRFDDGQPDSPTIVSLLRKDKAGKWLEFGTPDISSNGAATDDQGNFRLTGLPAGEYLLRTTLKMEGGLVMTPGVESIPDPGYRWDIYYGDGIRPSDAKIIKLKDGEQSNGNNLEIPLSRLHSISGTVVNFETGAPINSARVELHNADDDSLCTTAYVTLPTGQFRFPYAAEGTYTLKVIGAADVIRGKDGDEEPTHGYAPASQSILVKGETSGITIQVKPLPAAAATAAAQ